MRGNEPEDIVNHFNSDGPKSHSSSESCDDVECSLIDSNKRKRLEKFQNVDLNNSDLGNEAEFNKKAILQKYKNIRQLQQEDVKLSPLMVQIKQDPNKDNVVDYVLEDNILYYIGDGDCLRLVIPKEIQPRVIREAHEGYLGAHLGARKTYNTLCRSYYFRGMYAQVFKYTQGCPQCQSVNLKKKRCPIQEPVMPKFPFETIAIDTCGPFPSSAQGNNYVLTVVDMFTGYMECKCTPTKSAKEVAEFLVDEIIPRHSCPLNLVSDNGTEFCNKVIEHITKVLKVCHIKTTPYNPAANGRCERYHRVLKDCLTKLIIKDEHNWDLYVKVFAGAYNCADHTNTGYSPFQLIYNRPPVYPMDTLLQDREHYYGEDIGPQMIEKLHKIFRIVRKNIANQSAENRDRRNKGLKQESLKVGDLVYVYNQKRANKLHPKWLNGYIIVKKPSKFSFEVVDQLTQRTFKVHARNLRKAYPNDVWRNARQPVQSRPRRRARYIMTPCESEGSGNENVNQDDSDDDQLTDERRERYRQMRQQTSQHGQKEDSSVESDLNSDDMRERLSRLHDVGGDKIDERGHRDSGTLEQRPDPMLSPFPRRLPSGSVRSKPNTVGPTMSYGALRQQAMSSLDSSSGDYPSPSPVKVPEKGVINKDNGGTGGEVESTLSESTSDSDSNIPLAQLRDKLGMEDLQDQMSRLLTKEIPDERDRTVPSGGATGAQQSQSQDIGDVPEEQSNQRTQDIPLPSIKLTRVDGKWRAERLGRLVRVGDTWTRQPLEKVDDVEMVEILKGLNDGSNSGIRGSLRSKADQGATSNIGRALEKRKLQNLTQRLQRLQKKLEDRKVAHGMSGRRVKWS